MAVRRKVEDWRRREGKVKVGLSPHAHYSVSPTLIKRLAEWARAEGLPLMVHAAESPEEVAFLLRGEGPLREVYGRFAKTTWTPPGTTPVSHIHAIGVLGPTTLIVNGVKVDEEEVGLLAETGTKVVLCPRSNRNLEVGEAPLALYAKHGV